MRAPKRRVGGTAATYATASIEKILEEVLLTANKLAMAQSSKQLLSRHIQIAVLHNDAVNSLLGNLSIGTRETLPDPVAWILTKEQSEKREESKRAYANNNTGKNDV